MGGFCPLVELHWEGSAPAACAAGLFKATFLPTYETVATVATVVTFATVVTLGQ
jgi:hypothetical protein